MPTTIEFDLTDLKKFLKKLGQSLDKWMDKALTDYGLILEELIVDEIDRRKLSVSGNMKKSVTHDVKKRVMGWVLKVGVYAKTESGYPYPVGVHEGTAPHWAPIKPIKEWARLKLNIQNEKELNKAAYAIRYKISESGTEAQPFMSTVFTKERHRIRQEIGRALLRVMKGGRVV